MYWSAAKIDGHTVGTLALPILQSVESYFPNEIIRFFSSKIRIRILKYTF